MSEFDLSLIFDNQSTNIMVTVFVTPDPLSKQIRTRGSEFYLARKLWVSNTFHPVSKYLSSFWWFLKCCLCDFVESWKSELLSRLEFSSKFRCLWESRKLSDSNSQNSMLIFGSLYLITNYLTAKSRLSQWRTIHWASYKICCSANRAIFIH